MNCNKVLDQFHIGNCWFMAVLHALFFSENIRKHLTPNVEFMKKHDTYGEIANLIVKIFEYANSNANSNVIKNDKLSTICIKSQEFLTYLLFQNNVVINALVSKQNLYKHIEKSIQLRKDKYSISTNEPKSIASIDGEKFEYTWLDNYIIRCNQEIAFTVEKIVGGVPSRFLVPFLTSTLQQSNVLQFDILYSELNQDEPSQLIINQDNFNTIINTICKAIDKLSNKIEIIIITCSLGPNIKMSDTLNINNEIYSLESGIFGVHINKNEGHAIAGVKCGDKNYILDSFDSSSHELDWISKRAVAINEYSIKLKKDLEATEVNYGNPDIKDIFIYVKKDEENKTSQGGKLKSKKKVAQSQTPEKGKTSKTKQTSEKEKKASKEKIKTKTTSKTMNKKIKNKS
jgi:hypothetical protein